MFGKWMEVQVHMEPATLSTQKEGILILPCKCELQSIKQAKKKIPNESAGGLVQQTLMHITILGVTN